MQEHNRKLLDFIRSKGGLEMQWLDGLKAVRSVKISRVCEFQDAKGKVHLCPVFPGVNNILHPVIELNDSTYIIARPIGGSLDMRPRGECKRTFEEARDQYNRECKMSGSPARMLDVYEI